MIFENGDFYKRDKSIGSFFKIKKICIRIKKNHSPLFFFFPIFLFYKKR